MASPSASVSTRMLSGMTRERDPSAPTLLRGASPTPCPASSREIPFSPAPRAEVKFPNVSSRIPNKTQAAAPPHLRTSAAGVSERQLAAAAARAAQKPEALRATGPRSAASFAQRGRERRRRGRDTGNSSPHARAPQPLPCCRLRCPSGFFGLKWRLWGASFLRG